MEFGGGEVCRERFLGYVCWHNVNIMCEENGKMLPDIHNLERYAVFRVEFQLNIHFLLYSFLLSSKNRFEYMCLHASICFYMLHIQSHDGSKLRRTQYVLCTSLGFPRQTEKSIARLMIYNIYMYNEITVLIYSDHNDRRELLTWTRQVNGSTIHEISAHLAHTDKV